LKDVKIVPGFGDASYLNFPFVVLSLFWGNRNSISSFHIYQRHFTSNQNAFSNCLGRAKRELGLGGVFFPVLVCFEVTQIENHVLFSSYFKFFAMPGSIVFEFVCNISAFRCKKSLTKIIEIHKTAHYKHNRAHLSSDLFYRSFKFSLFSQVSTKNNVDVHTIWLAFY